MEDQAAKLAAQLSMDEKLSLLTGKNFWVTQPSPRLGIEPRAGADGP